MARSGLVNKVYSVPSRNTGSVRSSSSIKWVALHSAICCDGEGYGAENLGKYLSNGAGGRKVSWHYSTDSDSITGSLDEKFVGYHLGSSTANRYSVGIEMAVNVPGDWSNSKYEATLVNTAKLSADICRRNNIKPEILSASQLRAGERGIISHNLSRLVFGKTSHTDPGPLFPWQKFQRLVTSFSSGSGSSSTVVSDGDGYVSVGSANMGSVLAIQKALVSAGYPIDVDGVFGSETLAAVQRWQRSNGLDDDGIVGPLTSAKLLGSGVKVSDSSSASATVRVDLRRDLLLGFSSSEILDVLYRKYLGRAADSAGIDYWVGELRSGAVWQDVSDSIANSVEAKGRS